MERWKDALWDRFYAVASARSRQSVERYNYSQESLRVLAKRYGINQKTAVKWKRRTAVKDLPTGPRSAHSTVLDIEEEAIIVALCPASHDPVTFVHDNVTAKNAISVHSCEPTSHPQ